MKTALIISGGEYCELNKTISYDYLIACDKGAGYAGKLGLKPDIIIGDFDSYEGNVNDDFPDTKICTYPVMKDDTDTMLGIKHALANHYRHIIIICALGGQLDHTISNLESLYYICSHGGLGEIYSDREHLRTLSPDEGELILRRETGTGFSLFSLSEESTGVSVSGSEYDVNDIILSSSFPLGHGNSFREREVRLSVKTGYLLVCQRGRF